MKNKLISFIKNPYVLITLVYFATNCFLLILSGCWWDDWTFYTHNIGYIKEVASQSGRPEWNVLIPLCWSLINNGRILIFFLYFLDSIFVFNILKSSTLFNDKSSLLITLLFIVIPVNDSRLLISNFPYAVGLTIFYLGLLLFIKWNNKENKKTTTRILILFTFLVSFILNSLLAYYYIIFIYLFILDIKKNDENNIIKKALLSIKNVVIHYCDFFVLPFIYLVLNKTLFPVSSSFSARSSISLTGLLKCFKYLPLSMISIFKDIVLNMCDCLSYMPVLIIAVIVVAFVITHSDKKQSNDKKMYLLLLLFGLLIYILALFPYVEIRGSIISSIGVKGRDSILTPLGIALIVYSIINLFNDKVGKSLYVVFVLLCVLSCNLLYIEWQKDYYYQLSMENLMNNEIIENNDTFFFVDLNESNIEGQRYYSLNTNAYRVFNDETRFFIPKVSNLYILDSKEEIENAIETLNYCHMMKDYDPDDYCLDAVIIYECDLDWKQVLALKYYEIFDNDSFETIINNNGNMDIVVVDDEFTSILLRGVEGGIICNDNDVVEFLELYYNN